MEHNKRERVGIYIAAYVVVAYSLVGFINVIVILTMGQGIIFPSDWTASMLSLASASIGYLIGKQSTQPNEPVAVTTEGEKPLSVQAVQTTPVAMVDSPTDPKVTP